MPPADPAILAARLTRLAAPPTDADLLARYAAGRDGEAFAELVRRHGPMVLAACRRVTAHTHDAEDAFQATFLVLARTAGRVRPGPLAGWLYRVAVRAARKAATRPGRRWEVLGADVPDVHGRAADPFDPDAARAVAEEIERLPPHHRAAVVLCELEGRSRAAAARELGIAAGTLSSRLANARKRLAVRLAARGYGPAPLVALAGVAVPSGLAARTTALAADGPIPPAVATLTHGALRAMFLRKFTAVALAAAALVAAGVSATPPAPKAAPPAVPAVGVVPDPPKAAPAPKTALAGPNRIVVCRRRELVAFDPTGKNETTVLTGTPAVHGYLFAVSPDGKRAASTYLPIDGIHDKHPDLRLFVREFGAGGRLDTVEDGGIEHTVAWSADGRQLAVSAFIEGATPRDGKFAHFLYTFATKARTPVVFPDNHVLTDWSRDGRHFLTLEYRFGEPHSPIATWVMNRDGTPHKRLTSANTSGKFARFSPDGQRVLAARLIAPDEDEKENARLDEMGLLTRPLRLGLVVIDVATAKAIPLKDMPLNVDFRGFCWSPDGAQVAYTWRERHPPPTDNANRETQSHLTVCDADGGNQLTILTERAASEAEVVLAAVDWR
ncbi:MAG TPA: sigma-70 family RNA polymerase sigma factor [Urbifossiella sp.]|jgi:RNA polymerase sigma factor (sigma-70 family)|nr:sigma-70 family RNA polymerase sigma factor [Urbifossiella sp.]